MSDYGDFFWEAFKAIAVVVLLIGLTVGVCAGCVGSYLYQSYSVKIEQKEQANEP